MKQAYWVKELRELLHNPSVTDSDLIDFVQDIESLAQQRTEKKKIGEFEYYCVHKDDCPLAYWEAGRPTDDGGYETKWSGKWYKEPKKPKCTCGLSDLLK